MIRVTLVRVGSKLVGKTASDRWNLETLGIASPAYDRNQTAIKRLRRQFASWGFTFTLAPAKELPVLSLSPAESDALKPIRLPVASTVRLIA